MAVKTGLGGLLSQTLIKNHLQALSLLYWYTFQAQQHILSTFGTRLSATAPLARADVDTNGFVILPRSPSVASKLYSKHDVVTLKQQSPQFSAVSYTFIFLAGSSSATENTYENAVAVAYVLKRTYVSAHPYICCLPPDRWLLLFRLTQHLSSCLPPAAMQQDKHQHMV